MERVVIVAKTRMQKGLCFGALKRATNQPMRLRLPTNSAQAVTSPFEIGQLWDIEFCQYSNVIPPHVEDVCVMREHFIGQLPNLRETLLGSIQPWCGGVEELFDGRLNIEHMTAFINRKKVLPSYSTGYWLPDRVLRLAYRRDKPYYWLEQNDSRHFSATKGRLYIRYVGCATPLASIPAQTLLRVSLARWWLSSDVDEERCYLQISGWYL